MENHLIFPAMMRVLHYFAFLLCYFARLNTAIWIFAMEAVIIADFSPAHFGTRSTIFVPLGTVCETRRRGQA
jgi:hypothetical protein